MDNAYLTYERLRDEKGITNYRVSKDTGIRQTTLSDWKSGKIKCSLSVATKLANYFNVSVDLFTERNIELPESTTDHTHWVPVLGRVAAGVPAEMIEEVLDYEEIEDSLGEAFALQIKGASMFPLLVPDDVVIVKKMDDVESGTVAVVAVDGEDATCKKIIKTEDGVILQPLNPEFTPLFFSNEEITSLPVSILGRVMEIRRKL